MHAHPPSISLSASYKGLSTTGVVLWRRFAIKPKTTLSPELLQTYGLAEMGFGNHHLSTFFVYWRSGHGHGVFSWSRAAATVSYFSIHHLVSKSWKTGLHGSLSPHLSYKIVSFQLPQTPMFTRGGSSQIDFYSTNLGQLSVAQTAAQETKWRRLGED